MQVQRKSATYLFTTTLFLASSVFCHAQSYKNELGYTTKNDIYAAFGKKILDF
ncbi:MAG: hypothetical protein V4541_02950 [Bacteroidota bacterium]